MVNQSQYIPIRIWAFENAPEDLRDLSTQGGDEDWVALIPPVYHDNWLSWMDDGTGFGLCGVQETEHPYLPGWKVRIGYHA